MTDWLLSRWLSLDLDLIASTYEALDSHSASSFKCQTVLERVWTGAPLWPTLECCGYTGKLPRVNVTQILERKWHPGDIKGGKNDSLTLQVPVLLWLQENTKSSPVGMELLSEWNISFFPIDHLLLLTAGEIKWRLLSFLSPRSPRGRSVWWPQAYNVKQVEPTISQSAPPD